MLEHELSEDALEAIKRLEANGITVDYNGAYYGSAFGWYLHLPSGETVSFSSGGYDGEIALEVSS